MRQLCDYELARLARYSIPIMGGDPALDQASPKLQKARETHAAAVADMTRAANAFEALDPDAAGEDEFGEARTKYEEAKKAADKALREVERLSEIAAARAAHPEPDADDDEPASRSAKRGGSDARVIREPLTYAAEKSSTSYLLDLARVQHGRGDSAGARARLDQHRSEIRVELKERDRILERQFTRDFELLIENEVRSGLVHPEVAAAILSRGAVQKRAISRVDGSGGEFVPPLWVLDEFAPAIRAGRPFADRVRNLPLPGGTDSINIPIITVGGLTGFQTADGQLVTSRDWQTSSVLAPVRTVAGQLDVAMQLLDQSPINFDQIAFQDLFADYGLQVDIQAIQGNGGPGQLLGILNVAGIGATTYTDGTPTAPELYPKLAGSLNGVASARKRTASHMWMHSQRYYWLASQLDSSNRPFLPPAQGGPTNAYGEMDSAAQGPTGTMLLGVPTMLDQNIPTNLGAGTNEDRIISTVMDDHLLFEGDLRARALSEVLSGTLQVRLQVYAYVAFTAARFPAATNVIAGTGLVTPTF